ncbi:hypothetical protein AMATHDRAFT_68340 [Amanita thiersii Skay4041]|uniref:Ankyrin repeat protein n=1 Tax=Amanita thiersii Skay4041 TaxID=703135 RepID=A0A2A9NFX2_9AGAR|nr:hypothetical protein AMATHDRAFT_68340 [Amanita thiersii Skay4041]
MVHTAEAEAFLSRIEALPGGLGVSLDEVLKPSLEDEAELRRLFATDRGNQRLSDPYVGLVDVFAAPASIRTTRARVVNVDQPDEGDLNAKHVMPLAAEKRRKEGEPCMVADLAEFKKNWAVLTEGSLSQLVDWNNVVAAGGSVLACLMPLAEEDKVSKRAMRKFYHAAAYPTSDVDLFLWGMTPEEAEKKIVTIYEAVRDSVPWDVTCVRTKHTITLYSQYPYRSIQIVLRLYKSPAEILAGFDIDAPCCAYDGEHIWSNPRAIVAMMRQSNTVDVTRRSPSYEIRLSKYAKRGFEVYVPTLMRSDVDPTIFERSIVKIEGLARLLVLEKLTTADERQSYLQGRRVLRGRPVGPYRYRKMKRKYKNDLKALKDLEELEMNDYDVASLHIPYGPGWDARRIDKLIYQTDLGMNSTFNPKNKGRRLHRHPAFFGTIQECMEDCCENCPEPIDDAERELQDEEDPMYIRGRISFIEENPGRQSMTGSFNPIDDPEWSAQVYIGPTERFFTAIAAHDRATVSQMIKETDVNRRDHIGRSPLQFAIICRATEIACDLVDAGARMTARLVDGRTSLHLAVQLNQGTIVRKLLEKSALNKENSGVKDEFGDTDGDEKMKDVASERPSSEDDWSSEDDGVMEVDDEEMDGDDGDEDKPKKAINQGEAAAEEETPAGDEIPEDETSEPDVFDLNIPDWDFGLNPLAYAVLFASLDVLEDLIAAGADVKSSTQNKASNVHPLTLTALRPDEDEACKIAERLILAGASSSPADTDFRTIFLRLIASKKAKLVSTILRCDPNASAVINFPMIKWTKVTFPLMIAIHERQYSMVATLLAYGARLVPLEEDVTRAVATRPAKETRYILGYGNSDSLTQAFMPLEVALGRVDDIVDLLVAMGADINRGTMHTMYSYTREEDRRSVLDWVNFGIQWMTEQINLLKTKPDKVEAIDFSGATSWKEYAALTIEVSKRGSLYTDRTGQRQKELESAESVKEYLEDMRETLLAANARTWAEIPNKPDSTAGASIRQALSLGLNSVKNTPFERWNFITLTSPYSTQGIPKHLVPQYHELFEACFNGDDEKIQALCLPQEGSSNSSSPLQVTVQFHNPENNTWTGVTPFTIAVERRKWKTARLILAIAVAQYDADEEEVEFSVDDMDLDDSDDDSECSDESDRTIDQVNENFFVDIAKRPSGIQCDARPGTFYSTSYSVGQVADGRYTFDSVMTKAIKQDDLETFVKLVNMGTSLSVPVVFGDSILNALLTHDRHEMLDELIRKTGQGIDLNVMKREGKVDLPVTDKNKLYLGLNVHGKKRADLARKNDPDATSEIQDFPLLWRALRQGAQKIVDYVSGERPYAAYRSYAMSHHDERAERLRRIDNLKELLPLWHGWRVNSLGESPLTAAVLNGKVDMVKILFVKRKQLMIQALQERYKFGRHNLLQIAVRANGYVQTDMLDFLLSKKLSPLDTDDGGYNIYHTLCAANRVDLLNHLLKKLPSDVNEVLVQKQTKEREQTPLHVAVQNGSIDAVQLLVAFSTVANTMRDSDASLPLHVALRRGFAKITKILVDASPSTLFMEDGVGNTASEICSGIQFRNRMNRFNDPNETPMLQALQFNNVQTDPPRFQLSHLEEKIPALRQTVDSLLKEGRLRKNTKLEKELLVFADKMEGHMRRLQQEPVHVTTPEEKKEVEHPIDTEDMEATFIIVKEAVEKGEGKRELVHLIDVQQSVERNLKKSMRLQPRDTDYGLQAEEEKEVIRSFVREHARL